MAMSASERVHCRIPGRLAGQRLDRALSELLPECSRARLQRWLREGRLLVDGHMARPRDRVLGNELVCGEWPVEAEAGAAPEDLALDVVYEDEALIVVNKPPGMVVHPAAGNPGGTLVNALLHHAPELEALPRAGLVHRLDKDTSGLLVVARTRAAHLSLAAQLRARRVGREYRAVVLGEVVAGGRVEAPVGRHPVDRKRMAVVAGGRPATTRYRVLERYGAHCLLAVTLETGRTHQIRVHMAHLRHPVLGDPVYGGRPCDLPGLSPACREALRGFPRQALHALRLRLEHPDGGSIREWHAPLPEDMAALVQCLRSVPGAGHG